jgi:nucleoside-diphosphate-sugar epimerase
MSEPEKYLLLTGATGLLGQYLVRDMLQRGIRLALIVRGQSKLTAQQRLEQTMQMWERELGKPLPRPVVIEGDITKPGLDLTPAWSQWIRRHCDKALHCAASLTFHQQGEEPWRTNVDGTRNFLDLCQVSGIDEMHYISTAYVCGHRDNKVMEDDLDVGQDHRNDYEKSKFQAEQMVREHGFRDLTVYRPVVITGDAITGYTSTYHGTYLYMKLAKLLSQYVDPDENGNRHVPIRWGLTGEERRNITPVDWNSEIICRLYENPAAHGRTYHMAPQEPLTMREAIGYATDFYGITGIEFLGFKDKPPHELNDLEKWVWANIEIYGAYDFMDPEFDTTNLQQFAPEPYCPKLDQPMARRLMEYAEEDRWGKRKPPQLITPPWQLDQWLRDTCENPEPGPLPAAGDFTIVGYDVLGPGGGQRQVAMRGDQPVAWDYGLPPHSDALIRSLPLQDLVGTGTEGT